MFKDGLNRFFSIEKMEYRRNEKREQLKQIQLEKYNTEVQ